MCYVLCVDVLHVARIIKELGSMPYDIAFVVHFETK